MQSTVIDGVRYWFLRDDAMISMRFARNWADGLGLVWNPGERVEGYSNFLWTVFLGFLHLFKMPDSQTSILVLISSLAITYFTFYVIVRICGLFNVSKLNISFLLTACILNENLFSWTFSGFEVAILILLFLLTIYNILKDLMSNESNPIAYVLMGLIILVRADGFITVFILCLLNFIFSNHKKRVFILSLIPFLFFAANEIFRVVYYGDYLPNTAYLKTSGWREKYVSGFFYAAKFIWNYLPFILSSAIAVILIKDKRLKLLSLFIVAYSCYIMYAGGDVFEGFRFFMIILPLMFLLTAICFRYFIKSNKYMVACWILFILLMPTIFNQDVNIKLKETSIDNIKIGLMIMKNTPEHAKVADFFAGTGFYFSHRYGVDFLGKCDKYIAHLPPSSNGKMPGHNKFAFDYSFNKYKPDYVVAMFKYPADTVQMEKKAMGDFAFVGQLFFNKNFRTYYYPNSISSKTNRTIFEKSSIKESRNAKDWSL